MCFIQYMPKKKGLFGSMISLVVKRFLHYCGVYNIRSWELSELKKNGLKVGNNVTIDPRVMIDKNFCYLISIGDNSVICANVKLLAHDSSLGNNLNNHGKLGRIDIKENCIISIDSIVMPGVSIGPNVLVAGGSLINKDVPPNSCVAGVPARFYMTFDDFIKKQKDIIKNSIIFDAEILMHDDDNKNKLIKEIINKSKYNNIYLKNIDKFQ